MERLMGKEEQLEVYRQRYEVFRHLDTLRWQLFQTAIATAGIVLALGKDSIAAGSTWFWGAIALIFISIGLGKLRINYGVNCNNKMLKEVAEKIGDSKIPVRERWYTGVSNYTSIAMVLVGLSALVQFFRS
jgi:hypothetical protein